jgi:nitrite reductase (NADH) small subunit
MSDHTEQQTPPTQQAGDAGVWKPVATHDDLVKRRKVVVDVDGRPVLVLAHEGQLCAFDNICIHKQRELAKGVVLNGKLVCPGHQWAFALDSGYEAVKEECQPMFPVRVVDGIVEVDVKVPEQAPASQGLVVGEATHNP